MKIKSVSFFGLALWIAFSFWSNSASAWPLQHPDGAVHARIVNNTDEQYDAYFWWEGGSLYFEADPAIGGPFVCADDFAYVQGGNQGELSLKDSKKHSFCDNLFVKTILVVKGDGGQIKSSLDTTIINKYDAPVFIDVPKADDGGPAPTAPEVTISSLNVTKIVCKSKGSKVTATQTGDSQFSCDGLVVDSSGKVTITITGKVPQ